MTTMNNTVMDEISINTINMNTLDEPLNMLILEFYEPEFAEFLKKNFSEENISKVISSFRIRDAVIWEYVPVDNASYYYKKGYPCEPKQYSHDFSVYMDYKGKTWESTETKMAYKFYVPQKYKLYMSKVIKNLIYESYPWMKKFSFDCYSPEFNMKNYEFYLKCDNGRFMYVPMSTMTEHNPKIAEERTVSYYNDYYRWPGGWGMGTTKKEVMKWRKENTTDLIESKTWKKFCIYLDKKNFIDAEYISTWSDGSEVHTSCKVNLNTKEVVEGEFIDVPELDDEVCVNEFVKIGDEMISVFQKEFYEGEGFWYV